MILLSHILICALLMRIKGGGPSLAPRWFLTLDGAMISSVFFGVFVGLYIDALHVILAGLAWWLNAMSMGEEAGAIGGYRGNWIKNRKSWFGSKLLGWIKDDRVWGWVSSTLRGLVIGCAIALATSRPWAIAAGASFPLCYFFGISIEQYVTNKKKNVSWHWAEWIYGGIIGAAI